MADLLTGEQERELREAVEALEQAIAALDPVRQAAEIAGLQESLNALDRTMAQEDPTPELCPSCNRPEVLAKNTCEQSGHKLGLDGYCLDGPAYLPLGEKA